MSNILSIKNITKHYKNFKLDNVSVDIPKGSIVGFIGENGAGKTTTIKAILNLINIDSGEIKLFGLDHKLYEKEIKERIGVVLSDSFLPEQLNIKEIINIVKPMYINFDEDLFYTYVNKFNLPIDKPNKEFSTGMLMKLKIALCLAHKPELLILDEPTSGLDPIARNEILDIFQEFIEDENHSIFVSSHITSDLEHIADYIVFISNGKVILNTTKDNLIDNYGLVKCSEQQFAVINKKDYLKYIKNKYEYEVLVENKNEFIKKYEGFTVDKVSLDEIMLVFIKGEN